MELNRNHYLALGLFILLIGIQFRMVESFVLNDSTSKFISTQFKKPDPQPTGIAMLSLPRPQTINAAPKIIQPPEWLGWALMSVGGVLILHALAMGKPEGG